MLESVVGIGSLVLFAVVFAAIFRQAGHSGWYGILILIPLINVIAVIVLALQEWPIRRELCRLRLVVGEGTEEDASSVLGQAAAFERLDEHQRAVSLYELVADKMRGQPIAEEASTNLQRLHDTPHRTA